MNLPDNFLGFTTTVNGKADLSSYPLLYGLAYDVFLGSIGEYACLFLIPKETVKLPSTIKIVERLNADFKTPCVIVSNRLSSYQVQRLCERNIAWIHSENTFFLPFLGLSVRGTIDSAPCPTPLSPQAQRLAIHITDRTWSGKSATEVATLMGKSLASVSNYFKEIEQIAPNALKSLGRKRFISDDPSITPASLLDVFEPYLSSPVDKRLYLKLNETPHPLIDSKCFYAGISALSRKTTLGDNPWITYATTAHNYLHLDELTSKSSEVSEEDEPDIELEIWTHDIDSANDCVDDISLLLSFENKTEDDPRLDEALSMLRERIRS